MSGSLQVKPVAADELEAAFRLIFQHLSGTEQEARVSNAMQLVRRGELGPAGILGVAGPAGLLGALVCMPLPGAGGLVWPPQTRKGAASPVIEDLLVQRALAWLSERGAKLVQTLLPHEEAYLAAPLERNGFRHITSLWYLRHPLDLSSDLLRAEERLRYQPYSDLAADLFHETLLRSYEGTQDCPEVNSVRNLDEILEGHRAQGVYDPGRWWLAWEGRQPAGVLILAGTPEYAAWDVSYVGVVPESRGHGLGHALMAKALLETRALNAAQLTLSVDARNRPAWKLYRRLGFEPYDQREVYLYVRPAAHR